MKRHCKPDRSTKQILESISELAMEIAQGQAILDDESLPINKVKETLANCVDLLKDYLDEEVTHWLPQAIMQEQDKEADPFGTNV